MAAARSAGVRTDDPLVDRAVDFAWACFVGARFGGVRFGAVRFRIPDFAGARFGATRFFPVVGRRAVVDGRRVLAPVLVERFVVLSLA